MASALKRLSEASLELALQKAEHYRDLNQPDEAESICRDILDVRPGHQGALRTLGLALTDQFGEQWGETFDEALRAFAKLENEYERAYYAGVAWERCGKAQITARQGHNALVSLEQALEAFERAQSLTAAENPDPVLRWNHCVRMLTTNPLLLAAQQENRGGGVRFGD